MCLFVSYLSLHGLVLVPGRNCCCPRPPSSGSAVRASPPPFRAEAKLDEACFRPGQGTVRPLPRARCRGIDGASSVTLTHRVPAGGAWMQAGSAQWQRRRISPHCSNRTALKAFSESSQRTTRAPSALSIVWACDATQHLMHTVLPAHHDLAPMPPPQRPRLVSGILACRCHVAQERDQRHCGEFLSHQAFDLDVTSPTVVTTAHPTNATLRCYGRPMLVVVHTAGRGGTILCSWPGSTSLSRTVPGGTSSRQGYHSISRVSQTPLGVLCVLSSRSKRPRPKPENSEL